MVDALEFISHPSYFCTLFSDEGRDRLFESEEKPVIDQMEESFLLAPVSHPETFVTRLKDNPQTKALTDFKKGTTTLAFIFQGGIIVAADSRASMGSYIASQTVEKIIEINDYMLGTMAGSAADCSYWERHLSKLCQLYELQNGERISVASASNLLSNIFMQYRQYHLSCGTMIAGCDHDGPKLYYVDNTGMRLCGSLFSVGSGSTYAYGVLDSEYSYTMSFEEAVELAQKAIYHAAFRDAASGGVVRVYHVHANGWTKVIQGKDVNILHEAYGDKNRPE